MKRIVDIPDEVLESKHYCQYFGAWSTKLTELIEQSTLYNPSGDLISRSDLKAELEVYRHDETRYVSDEEEAQNRLLDNILEDIDNAPTIDLWQMRQEATENALKKADEWISVKDKLPEPLISVIVTDNNDVFVAWYNEGWKSSDSQFDEHTPIVAWRPIPRYTESEKGGAE